MKQKRIYILPSRFGTVFIIGAIFMILIGASYQNNMVNLLAYFMLSLVFVSMIQTHNNLKDVRVSEVETEGGFEGQEFVVTVILASTSKDVRFGLEVDCKGLKARSKYENHLPLLAGSVQKLRVSYPATTRGRHRLRSVKVSSVFPLGLFRVWRWFDVDAVYYVYPAPKGDLQLPQGVESAEEGPTARPGYGDDFQGHRKFEIGDSPRHIDWKARARGRPLLVKEFGGGTPGSLSFDWYHLQGASDEARASQLALWIDEARKRKHAFSLRLPKQYLMSSQGLQHATRCLEALAVFDREGGS